MITDDAVKTAEKHVRDILSRIVEYSEPHEAMVVYDSECELAGALTRAYRGCLPGARFIDFEAVAPEAILTAFKDMAASDLVVLIQSTSFRLVGFRIRVELFKRGIKVIEHPHLARMTGPEALYYIDALAYDAAYYRGTGRALKALIDRACSGRVDSGGEELRFDSPFESAKLNIGDYTGMKNVGGQFPIGEVFTEAKDLEAVNGRVRIFAFGDRSFTVNRPQKPVILIIRRGRVTGVEDATPEFERVLADIRADEEQVWVRELGFGMNRAFTRERVVQDIGTYERMCGIHLSLGAKHPLYKKPGFRVRDTRHHVDVFAVTESVTLDGTVVYRDGAWQV